MAKRAKTLEARGAQIGREVGRLANRLEKETRRAARRGQQMQGRALKRSVSTLRRGAWALNKLALELEKTGRRSRRAGRSRRSRRKR